jgi:hypothetical protein
MGFRNGPPAQQIQTQQLNEAGMYLPQPAELYVVGGLTLVSVTVGSASFEQILAAAPANQSYRVHMLTATNLTSGQNAALGNEAGPFIGQVSYAQPSLCLNGQLWPGGPFGAPLYAVANAGASGILVSVTYDLIATPTIA